MKATLSLGLNKFLWTKRELCNIEKADQAGGYKWQRKDGSWWMNHGGQVVPYHAPTHGAIAEHPEAKHLGAYHDSHKDYASLPDTSTFEDRKNSADKIHSISGHLARSSKDLRADDKLLADIADHAAKEALQENLANSPKEKHQQLLEDEERSKIRHKQKQDDGNFFDQSFLIEHRNRTRPKDESRYYD